MWKLLRLALVGVLIYGAFLLGSVVQDRQTLSDEVIRLHVVAASDSQEDQQVKLQIRDAVVELLSDAMEELETVTQAKAYLSEHLQDIADTAKQVLESAGFTDSVTVSLEQEAFESREYDTFTLPAGVYDALRIVVGEGEGQNWWCVVFPSLCLPQTAEDFAGAAVSSGFSDTLTQTLANDDRYPVRFFLLECLGKLQNFFFRR